MAYKTREQLMKEIDNKNEEIKSLKEDIEKLDRFAKYSECADELAAARESFVNAGFTKAEAFELLIEVVKNATVMNSNIKKVNYKSY